MPNSFIEIAGYGQTKFGELYDHSLIDLMTEATDTALAKAGISIAEVDAVFIGNMISGEVSDQSHLGAVFSEKYNFNGAAYRVEGACASGSLAIYSAVQALKAGSIDTALVIGVEKMTDYDSSVIGRFLMQAASQEERDAGLSFPGLYALMAKAYMAEFNLSREELALAPFLMHKNAVHNEKAQFRKEFTVDQILGSAMIADPLRLLDCSPISDGGAAIILKRVETTNGNCAYIAGIEVATDSISLSKRENIFSLKAAREASKKLRNKLNFSVDDVQVLEVHDCFSVALFMALEDLGFAEQGRSVELVKNIIDGKSDLILNPSGGLKACGHPVGATGVKQIIELAKCINGDKKLALSHNVGGSGGTAVVSLICNNLFFNDK